MTTAQESRFTVVPGPRRADRKLGVLTWNIQHAAPRRAGQQANWIAACPEADIVVLTEVGAGQSGAKLMDLLGCQGYAVRLPASDGDYRVAIASRVGAITVVDSLRADFLPHRWLVATVSLPGGSSVAVAGVYVPSRGPRQRRNVAKRAFQGIVADLLPALPVAFDVDVPVLVAGDLNVVEPGHRPHHSVFGAWEYDFYRAFGVAGFIDCFRHLRPTADDHSWYGRSGDGYRFDHLFISSPHASMLGGCRYDHTPRRAGLSDHAAMIASIQPAPSHRQCAKLLLDDGT